MLGGVSGHQSQLRSSHCGICTASCKACPPLVQVVPTIVTPVTGNSNHGSQQFTVFALQSLPLVPLGQVVEFNIAMNSSHGS